MTPEERIAHLEELYTAAQAQYEKLQISCGQAYAVVEYLRKELRQVTPYFTVEG